MLGERHCAEKVKTFLVQDLMLGEGIGRYSVDLV